MEKGTMYMVLPFIQPVNLFLTASSMSSGEIQLPSLPTTPAAGSGMVSLLLFVQINVFDSTLATSFGSVRARKLQQNQIRMILYYKTLLTITYINIIKLNDKLYLD